MMVKEEGDDTKILDKPFGCDQCDAKYKSKLHLICHQVNFHSKMATFQCPHCEEYSNTSRFEVMNHIKSDHQPKRAFQCQNCSQSFDSEAYLRIHTRHCPPI